MNFFLNRHNPMQAMGQGMNLWKGMEQSYDAQMERARQQREREALSQMGQAPLLAGFEDNPQAMRPDWLQQLYQSGNPELALRAEAIAAQPFLQQRQLKGDEARMRMLYGMEEEKMRQLMPLEAEKAGKIKEAEMAAKVGAWKDMMPAIFGGPQGSGNALARPASVSMTTEGGMLPPGGGVMAGSPEMGGLGRALTGEGLSGLSGGTYETEFDLNRGPVFKHKPMSPLEEELKRRESILKGRDTELKSRETDEKILQNERQALSDVHRRVFDLTQAKKDLKKDFAAGDISPEAYRADMQALDGELSQAKAYRDHLRKGGQVEPEPAPQQAPAPQPAQQPSAQPAARPAPPAVPRGTDVGAGLPYKMQQTLKAEDLKGKLKDTRERVEGLYKESDKFASKAETMNSMYNLIANNEIGSPWYDAMPFGLGEDAASLANAKNQELMQYSNIILDAFKPENASRTFDTLPELRIIKSQLPTIGNRPDLNRKIMASLMNKYEAALAAPKFFDEWAAANKGSLKGAREMFREWMAHNKRHSTEKVKGSLQMRQQQQIPLENWVKLRKKYPASEILKMRDQQRAR